MSDQEPTKWVLVRLEHLKVLLDPPENNRPTTRFRAKAALKNQVRLALKNTPPTKDSDDS